MKCIVVFGYFGSQPSSFVNTALQQLSGERICVIENRLAVDIGLESQIERSLAACYIEVIEPLEHLCICCSDHQEFIYALNDLERSADTFDTLLVVCTGLCDPSILTVISSHSHTMHVHHVVSMVDTAHALDDLFCYHLADPELLPIPRAQLAASNVVLLRNSAHSDTDALRSAIQSLGCQRKVFSEYPLAQDTASLLRRAPAVALESLGHLWLPLGSRHESRVSCASLIGLKDADALQLSEWLRGVMRRSTVFCARGVVSAGHGRRITLEATRHTGVRCAEGSPRDPSVYPVTKVALVGLRLSSEMLAADLRRHSGVSLNPTVLFSSAPPRVNTWAQSALLWAAILALLASYTPGGAWVPESLSQARHWTLLALLIYWYLSSTINGN